MLPLRARRLHLVDGEIRTESVGALRDAVIAHLAGEGPGGLVLVGGFGSGKTSLCRDLHEHPPEGVPPITFVPLAVVGRASSPSEGLRRTVGPARLDEAREGRRILLLDGLDEVPDPGTGSYDAFLEEILDLSGPRWVLTSRPGHVRTTPDEDPTQADTLTRPHTTTLAIDPLDPDTVRSVLGRLHGGEDLLRTVGGLADLATSPLLLHIVEAALPHIEPGRPIEAWGLFDAWLRHALHTGPDHDEALARLSELAGRTYRESGFSTEAMSFAPADLAAARVPPALRRTVMVTELDGRVRFGHRSVFEFLLAGWIAPRLAANQGHGPDELSGRRITEATRAFLVGRVGRLPVRVEGSRVRIPRGNFVAGGVVSADERRLRISHVPDPYWIDRAPVTGAEWAAWLAVHPDPRQDASYLPHWGVDRRLPTGEGPLPVHGIWPEDAEAYAAWRGARLPTADEWEKAVRGHDGRRWPWGDTWRPGAAVTAELGVARPLPVRAFGAHGPSALFEAVGGVFECTATPWRGRADRGRVVMGGCYTHPHPTARPSLRLSHKLSGHLKLGVRLAWSDDA